MSRALRELERDRPLRAPRHGTIGVNGKTGRGLSIWRRSEWVGLLLRGQCSPSPGPIGTGVALSMFINAVDANDTVTDIAVLWAAVKDEGAGAGEPTVDATAVAPVRRWAELQQ